MKNRELAILFNKIGDALEFKGEMTFKVSAYRKVARILEDLTEDIKKAWEEGKLRSIPGIGEGIAKKIDEYLRTGKMKKYEEVMFGIPTGLLSLLSIQSLGVKTLKLATEKLGVNSETDLRRVIEDGSLAKLHMMGEKKVENIKRGLEIYSAEEKRISIGVALPLTEEIIDWMEQAREVQPLRRSPTTPSESGGQVEHISPAGSLRRMKETIGDIDILVAGMDGEKLIDHFTKFPRMDRVLAKGTTKGSIIVREGYQIDMRIVPTDSYGAALQYFTGSKAHNIKLRTIAKTKGLKISEYGVFRGEEKIAGATEEEVYATLGLPLIPSELREDKGEIEIGELPEIVNYNEIQGDLHIHSKYSDGANSIREIAEYAKKIGYKYIAITDHSKSAGYAGGIDENEIEQQSKEIEKIEKEVGIRILKGIEMEVKKDGSFDLPAHILNRLDIVVAAIHTAAAFGGIDMTQAIISACQNPYIDIIAHPTGRLISRRTGYKVDLEAIMKAAKDTGTLLEINCYYDRLDLSDVNAKRAKERGVKLSLGSDAHNLGMLNSMRLGVGVARRAWLSKHDIINTSQEPTKYLKHKRK